MIFEIFNASISIKRKAGLFLLIQCIITFFLIITTLNSANQASRSVNQLELVTGSLYKVNDNFIGDSEKQFFAQPDNVSILKRLYSWESSNRQFQYIIANQQYASPTNKQFPDKFEVGYESGNGLKGTYNSLQINSNFITKYCITLSEGQLFSKKDYSINKIIPILMGSEYKNYVKLHDKFKIYYLSKELNCQVKGFLKDNSYYNNGYNIQTLNRYIIIPSFEIPTTSTNPNEKAFELKLYLDKCGGYLSSTHSASFVQNLFTEKCYSLDIKPYTLEGISSFYPTMWGLEGKQLQNLLLMFVAVIVASSIICMSINMATKIMALKRDYAIYIANGVSKRDIYLSIFLEIAFMNGLSLLLMGFGMFLLGAQIQILQLISIYLILCLISCIYPFIVLKNINLSKVIRGDE